MAKKGEIDPWNIDIVELADKFLRRVEDLRVSARVLLYAAILLRMKAEVLVSESIVEEVEEEPPEMDFTDPSFDLPMEVVRETKVQEKRPKRYTTLQELIRELMKAEKIAIRKRRISRKEERRIYDVMEVPHEEDMEETITKVYEEIMRSGCESFFELVRGLDRGGVVSYYFSILHLTYRGKLEIEQDRFYEDIKIRLKSLIHGHG